MGDPSGGETSARERDLEMKRLASRLVKNLDEATLGELKKCCYRDGTMSHEIGRLYVMDDRDAKAIIQRDDDGTLLGWALLFNNRYAELPEAHFYVPPKNRRHGIGRKLAESVRRKAPSCIVHPWNHTSERFFENWPGFICH